MAEQLEALRIFYSYSHKDEKLRAKLETHLSLLQHQGFVQGWNDRKIGAGEDWKGQISKNLEEADIIFLLISADFLASHYCYDVEMVHALERSEEGSAQTIPIILRDVDWHQSPVGHLQALPKDGRPINGRGWRTQDEAWTDVARGIRAAVDEFREKRRVSRLKEPAPSFQSSTNFINNYTEALEYWRHNGDRHGQAHALLNLGLAYGNNHNWDKSIASYLECIGLLSSSSDVSEKAQVLVDLGLVYDYKGEWDNAINALKGSLPLFDEEGDFYRKAQALEYIGLVYDRKVCKNASGSDKRVLYMLPLSILRTLVSLTQ